MIEPREFSPRERRRCEEDGRPHRHAEQAGREELAGVRERGMHTWGLPGNLGDLVVSAHESREGHPVEQPRPGGGALAAAGSEARAHARYRQAKETKCGGMVAGRHSVSIVPMKLANSTRLEPVEESETPIHGTVFEKHDECIEIR